jgi:hypothetical protein
VLLWKKDREVRDLLNLPEGEKKSTAEVADFLIMDCCFVMPSGSTR